MADKFMVEMSKVLSKTEMDTLAVLLWNSHKAIYNAGDLEKTGRGLSWPETIIFAGEIASLAAGFDIYAGW